MSKHTRSSSRDETANVNFLYNDIVHIYSCINSATDRRGYVLERGFTKFSEITQYGGHYTVQGHRFWCESKAHIRLLIKTLTYLLSCTVSKLWLIIGQIFASESRVPHFNAFAGVIPANIAINDISLKLDSMWSTFPLWKVLVYL